MVTTRSFHSARHRHAAIRAALDERRADRHRRIRIIVNGPQVILDGTADAHVDKVAALDAALLVGEAEVVIDRIAVGRCGSGHPRAVPGDPHALPGDPRPAA